VGLRIVDIGFENFSETSGKKRSLWPKFVGTWPSLGIGKVARVKSHEFFLIYSLYLKSIILVSLDSGN
jgi:hypothetical protein